VCDFFVRSPTSVKSPAGQIWTARHHLNVLSYRVRLVSEAVTAKVKQQQKQLRLQHGLFCTVSLQKWVAIGTKPALLITCVRVILPSSDAQCVHVTGGTMQANTFKATRPCGILQAAAWAHVTCYNTNSCPDMQRKCSFFSKSGCEKYFLCRPRGRLIALQRGWGCVSTRQAYIYRP
jgi:hypothetical protein